MQLVKQNYPLSVTYKQAEKLVVKIYQLVKLFKGEKKLTKKEYNLLNDITTPLVHPHKKEVKAFS